MTCKHSEFKATVEVAKVEDVPGLVYVDLAVACRDCGEPLVFHGAPMGHSAYRVMIEFGGHALRAPATIDGATVPDGLPGFVISERGGTA